MKPVRTALVGCGKEGGLHAAALSVLAESELVAVCDSSLERAERIKQKWAGSEIGLKRKIAE
jgi:UDP-N-acetyl-2-amino-2-deoxyglucuronate dehydrogenase